MIQGPRSMENLDILLRYGLPRFFSFFFFLAMVVLGGGCGLFQGGASSLTPAQQAAMVARRNGGEPDRYGLHSSPVDKVGIYTALATAYLQGGHPRQCIRELRIALRQHGNRAPAYNVLGLAYESLAKQGLAESAFRHALADNPGNPQIRNNYGAFLLQQKNYPAAVRELRKATADPLYATPQFAWTNLALAYRGMKKEEEALGALQRALYFQPGYPPALILWAEMEYRHGDLASAHGHLQEALAQEPGDPQALLLAGKVAFGLGKHHEAKAYWQRCVMAAPYSQSGKAAQKLLLEHGGT